MPKKLFLGLTRWEWLYVLLCFGLCFAASLTFTQDVAHYGPDEWGRIMVPQYIAQHRAIPTGTEPALLNDVWGYSYALQMKLPYLLGGVSMGIAGLLGAGETGLLAAARLVSCLSMAGVAYWAIRLAKRFTVSPCRWVFIGLLTLTPQSLFLGSYFNLDAYSLLTVLMIVDSWASGLRSGWRVKSCVYLGVSMGLCVLGYEFAYGYLVASVVLFAGWFLLRRERSFGRFFGRGCCVAAVFLLVCGWYFVRNYRLFDGDIFAYRVQNVYGELCAREELKPSQRATPLRQGLSLPEMLWNAGWIKISAYSAFGLLGYMTISLPSSMYWVYALFLLVGCGAFAALRPKAAPRGEAGAQRLFAAALLLGAAIDVGLSVFASYTRDFQPQGRYILYALVPVYMGAALGWQALGERLAAWRGLRPRPLQGGLAACFFAFLGTADLAGGLLLLAYFR